MEKKLAKVFLTFSIVLSMFFSMYPPKVMAEESGKDVRELFEKHTPKEKFIKRVDIKFMDGETEVSEENVTFDKTRLDVYIYFGIPNEVAKEIDEGDYYQATLTGVKFDKELTGSLKNKAEGSNDELLATYHVTQDGVITFKFTDEVRGLMEIEGAFKIEGNFNSDLINDDGELIVGFPSEENIPEVNVVVKPPKITQIEKSGIVDRNPNPNKITWNITINKSLETLNNVKVVEDYPEDLEFVSVEVYKIFIKYDGTINTSKDPVLVDKSEYTYENNTVSFKNEIRDAYRIELVTKIKDEVKDSKGPNFNIVNKATLNSDELGAIDTSSTVSVTYNKMIEKRQGYYNPDTQESTWEIYFNYREKELSENEAYFTDTFETDKVNSVFKKDSVIVQRVTFSENGQETRENAELGKDYNFTMTDTKLEVQFLPLGSNPKVKDAYLVTYVIDHDDVIPEGMNFRNVVKDKEGNEVAGNNTWLNMTVLNKYHGQVNFTDREISWTVDINKPGYTMKNWSLTDTIGIELEFLEDTFTILDTNNGQKLKVDVDYTLIFNHENSLKANEVKIVFINDYKETNHRFILEYKTSFLPNDSSNKIYLNNVKLNFTSSEDEDYEISANDYVPKLNETASNGSKWGTYNAKNKHITWSVAYDYNNYGIDVMGTIEDKITGNQVYVPDSLRAYKYTIHQGDGKIVKGEEVNLDEIISNVEEPSSENDYTLKIELKRLISVKKDRYMIEFDTTLEGKVIDDASTYNNKAIYDSKTGFVHELDGTVSIAHAGEKVSKTGIQNDQGYVVWTINVNRSQSTLNDVKVIDTFSSEQIVKTDSIKVYGTTVDEAGNISRDEGNLLKENEDYKLEIRRVEKEDETSGEISEHWQLEIDFLINPITTAYQIEYMTQVMLESNAPGQTVSNDVKIIAFNEETINQGHTEKIPVSNTTGQGVIIGRRGSFEIKKTDSEGKGLEGAVIQILKEGKDGVAQQIGKDFVTDENGLIVVKNLGPGEYIIKETKAPQGYLISPELKEGIKVKVEYPGNTEIYTETIVNKEHRVLLNKVDEEGNFLKGAKFDLLKEVDGTYTKIKDIESDENGLVEIKALEVGKYKLEEVKAPEGYIINTESIVFEITDDVTEDLILSDYVNYKGSFNFVKFNEDGDTLEGVEYNLLDESKVLLDTLKTDDKGEVFVEDLNPGTYYLEEIKAIEGYILNTSLLEIVISSKNEGVYEPELYSQVNYQGKVKLLKVGSDKKVLEGVEFKLERKNGEVLYESLKTDNKGEIHVSKLEPGDYVFVELKTIDGYILNEENVPFTIEKEFNGEVLELELLMVNEKVPEVPEEPEEPELPEVPVVPTEPAKPTVPHTGIGGVSYLNVIIASLALFFILRSRKYQ